jgi:phage tail-like protein
MPDTGVRLDPFTAFRFVVVFDDLLECGFSDCTGLQVELESQDYIEGGLNTHTWKFPTRAKQSNLTLKRGVINRLLWDWLHDVATGNMKYRSGTIIVLDSSGRLPVMTFLIQKAFPVKWVGPELSAAQNNVAMETLELAHQGMERLL